MIDEEVDLDTFNYVYEKLQTNHMGNRGIADGNKEQQIIGGIGEVIIRKTLGLPKPTFDKGFDGGIDLDYDGKTIDVKTMGRTVAPKPDYVNNFIAFQKNFDCDYLAFCSFNKINWVLTICGIIEKVEFLEKADYFPEGVLRYRADGTSFETKAPMYELTNDKLKGLWDVLNKKSIGDTDAR